MILHSVGECLPGPRGMLGPGAGTGLRNMMALGSIVSRTPVSLMIKYLYLASFCI